MTSLLSENHKIRDVDYSNSQFWCKFPESGGSSDNFKHHLSTDTADDDVGIDALIRGGEWPNGSTGATMSVCLLGSQPDSGGLFRPDHQVDVVLLLAAD